MNEGRLRLVLCLAVSLVVFAVYLYSVAPTASFWDCGELIAVSYIQGVPHPPGAPLFVMLGRIFTMLPLGREIAFRVNMIPVLFGAASCGLIYLLVVKLLSLYVAREPERNRWLAHVAGIFGALACGFAYSYWDNCVEAEVYGPCVVVALSVLYMALVWRDHVDRGTGDNRLILAAMFLLFLSAGIHFTPMLTVFALLVFGLVVDRKGILGLRLFEFMIVYLAMLAVKSNITAFERAGVQVDATGIVAAVLMLGVGYFGIWVMERWEKTWSVLAGLGLVFMSLVIGLGFTGGDMMDDVVLFLASPIVALVDMWNFRPRVEDGQGYAGQVGVALVLVLVLIYVGYLFWLRYRRKLSLRYVGMMLGLVLLAGSVQFVMMIRAKHRPSINEVEPAKWRDFVSVLKREQYDPMRLYPRKTQFLAEELHRQYLEWLRMRNDLARTDPRQYREQERYWREVARRGWMLPLGRAYIEQIAFYVRYFFWQWSNENYFDMLFTNFPRIFLRFHPLGLLGLIPVFFGLWGMWHQFRRDKRSFTLIFVAFIVASLGLLTYLNLKYSPSDPRRGDFLKGQLGYLEVRERDYFYAFSFVFYTIFVGVGSYAFLRWAAEALRQQPKAAGGQTQRNKSGELPVYVTAGALIAFAFVPMGLNYRGVTRRGNWIPAEYGYNMLISCPGEHAVVFTNGDNDTFPLWFMQTVPSAVADFDPNFGKNVAVANLSLLNTNWYCKQLKRWGAPISFRESQIDSLPQYLIGEADEVDERGRNRERVVYLKDIMIRNIVATSAGIELVYPDDYKTPPSKFMEKVFGVDSATGRSRYNPRSPVYFATTVSPENTRDVNGYLELEGLVRRVVPTAEQIPGETQVNIGRTRELLFSVFRTKSMLDPKVERDENTSGLMTNYAHSYLMLAVAYQRLGMLDSAEEVLKPALKFDLDSSQKSLLFLNLSRFSLLNRHIADAAAAADSAKVYGYRDPRLTRDIALQVGYTRQALGDLAVAESSYLQGMAADPDNGIWVEMLYRLYVEQMRDTGKARQLLQMWLQRHPNDVGARQLLEGLGSAGGQGPAS